MNENQMNQQQMKTQKVYDSHNDSIQENKPRLNEEFNYTPKIPTQLCSVGDETALNDSSNFGCSMMGFCKITKQQQFLEQTQNPKLGEGISEYCEEIICDIHNVEDEQKWQQCQFTVEETNPNIGTQKSQVLNTTEQRIDIEQDFHKFRLELQRKKSVNSKNYMKDINSPSKINSFRRDNSQSEQYNLNDNNDVQIGLVDYLKQKQEKINNQFKIILRTINIKKFMNIMKGKSKRLLFRYMSPTHFDIIGDNASDFNFYYYGKQFYSKVQYSSILLYIIFYN